jgi:hypothetical protein
MFHKRREIEKERGDLHILVGLPPRPRTHFAAAGFAVREASALSRESKTGLLGRERCALLPTSASLAKLVQQCFHFQFLWAYL